MTLPPTHRTSLHFIPPVSIILLATVVFSSVGCAKRSRIETSRLQSVSSQTATKTINLNTATAAELEVLPGIGKALATRIVEHRDQFGRFRRAEHLIIVRGISDKRFRALQHLITVE
jgi:competence ComEA-like helix-hairpin-helix protein